MRPTLQCASLFIRFAWRGSQPKASAQSGLTIDRLDRVMAKNEPYCLKGGLKKGTYYSLNNQGLMKAGEVLRAMYS